MEAYVRHGLGISEIQRVLAVFWLVIRFRWID